MMAPAAAPSCPPRGTLPAELSWTRAVTRGAGRGKDLRTIHRACQRTDLGFNRKSILRVGSVRRVGGVGEDKEGGERERET